MDIEFTGKYKSITDFVWNDIPSFVVITGPNGTGKSQLLELIFNTVINHNEYPQRALINGGIIEPDEVTFRRSEWDLQDTVQVNLSSILSNMSSYYSNFVSNQLNYHWSHARLYHTYRKVLRDSGKSQPSAVTKEEFDILFPRYLVQHEGELSQKIGEIFYDYRLSEIELQAQGNDEKEIKSKIGEKPWDILREIIKTSKLPFEINDPSNNGIRDSFHLRLTHSISKEEINFIDLSSGEKVLISIVFYLYNSQEKKAFPKLLLLDEPDAHLHPSMTQQFLSVIKSVLVDKFNVQVIMTTHSPSTVILSSEDSIYEMSRTEPRIRKAPSKNHCVSLLTAGLVFVGEGTKYFLVEDKDDSDFYTYVYNQLKIDGLIDSDIPLVFIPASTKDSPGGKSVVQTWVSKLKDSGLIGILQGLIDADNGNTVSDGIYKIDRYSIENYLADPLLVYAALIDKEQNPVVDNINFTVGEEYKIKNLPEESLQKIADKIFELVGDKLIEVFPDFDLATDNEKVVVKFIQGIKLKYPNWVINRRGKDIINQLYNKVFASPVVNYGTLFKALRKLNMFPTDLKDKLEEIKGYN